MINEMSIKVSNLDYSRKSENKKNDHNAPVKQELENRSDLRHDDAIEISGHKPVEMPAEKVIKAVSIQENDLHLLSDVNQKEANVNGFLSLNVQGTEKGNSDINNKSELSDEEKKEVEELHQRDNQVRQHEYAHIAAAGAYAQGVSFSYQAGPDGQRYAVGGEVSIDTSPVQDNPDATIAKASVIRAAAIAPADPSAQDRQVAAAATRMEAAARAEKMQEATGDGEGKKLSTQGTDNKTAVDEKNEPMKSAFADKESSLVDSLTSAYGKKETEVGKVIRLTA